MISAVSLLFAPGKRPTATDVEILSARVGQFTIIAGAPDGGTDDQGWLELLAGGLTFDLTGLAPLDATQLPAMAHSFGLATSFEKAEHEAILLRPGPHLAAGAAMFPVVRTLAMIAAYLVELEGVEAVVWHPARAVSAADYFRRSVLRWIEGGAFPGLGLSALVPQEDGSLQSEGLTLFTGQELRMRPEAVTDMAEAAKVALRLMNWLVEHGRITESFGFTGPSGETLRLEPVNDSGIIEVWRGSL